MRTAYSRGPATRTSSVIIALITFTLTVHQVEVSRAGDIDRMEQNWNNSAHKVSAHKFRQQLCSLISGKESEKGFLDIAMHLIRGPVNGGFC